MTRFTASLTRFFGAALALTCAAELFVRLFHVSRYMMPPPFTVWKSLAINGSTLLAHSTTTLMEAAAGFACGTTTAVLVAMMFTASKTLRRLVFPLTIAIQTVPLIVTAPVLVLIFGNGMAPKVILSALICFFPTVIHMTKGLTQVDPSLLDVFRMLQASESAVLLKLRFPSSIPDLFSTLKLASANCVIGSILGEWVSSDRGIGFLLSVYLFQLDVTRLYATVIAASLVAVVMLTVVEAAESVFVGWKRVPLEVTST